MEKSTGGRPSKLSPQDIHHCIHQITSGKCDNAVQVTKSLQDITNITISPQTVRDALKTSGMKAVVKKKRPLLTKRHRMERLYFAERHQNWTVDDWKKVVWSDETKINRMGSDGRLYVWKQDGEPLHDRLVEGTKKFGGGSLMLWGCMFWEGVGNATRIDGKMDAELYCQILEDDLMGSLEWYGLEVGDVIFQQDNDPKHTSKRAKSWFEDHGFNVLKWPAQSPDLNPIEHLWNHLKRRLAEYPEPPNGVIQLWERVEKEWEAIPKEVCKNLIESMPRRIEAVLKAKGSYTKY